MNVYINGNDYFINIGLPSKTISFLNTGVEFSGMLIFIASRIHLEGGISGIIYVEEEMYTCTHPERNTQLCVSHPAHLCLFPWESWVKCHQLSHSSYMVCHTTTTVHCETHCILTLTPQCRAEEGSHGVG